MTYHHPVFTASGQTTQREHASLIRRNRTSFCGAYWGYGFHEDGVNSALAVGRAFGEELDS
jgi:predicted NAD/FAD-binding protein